MSNLKKWQGTVFYGHNMADFYRYIADYLQEYPDCTEGFGLEFIIRDGVPRKSSAGISSMVTSLSVNDYSLQPALLVDTVPDNSDAPEESNEMVDAYLLWHKTGCVDKDMAKAFVRKINEPNVKKLIKASFKNEKQAQFAQLTINDQTARIEKLTKLLNEVEKERDTLRENRSVDYVDLIQNAFYRTIDNYRNQEIEALSLNQVTKLVDTLGTLITTSKTSVPKIGCSNCGKNECHLDEDFLLWCSHCGNQRSK